MHRLHRIDAHIRRPDPDVDLGKADQLTVLRETSQPRGCAAAARDQTLQQEYGGVACTPRLSHHWHQGLENRAERGFHLQLSEEVMMGRAGGAASRTPQRARA